MFDLDDPILKDGKTSYPIEIKNQGTTPATNVRVKAKIPELLEFDNVFAPVKYSKGYNKNNEFWVEFEPIETLAGGETQTFNISVKARGQAGDARFHVEMTADQLDRGQAAAKRRRITGFIRAGEHDDRAGPGVAAPGPRDLPQEPRKAPHRDSVGPSTIQAQGRRADDSTASSSTFAHSLAGFSRT